MCFGVFQYSHMQNGANFLIAFENGSLILVSPSKFPFQHKFRKFKLVKKGQSNFHFPVEFNGV